MKKTITNEIRCTFLSKSENEALARSIISGFLIPLDPDVEELADIRCAVSEAVTNCIVHAYRDTIGKISLDAKCYDDRTVKITVTDHGVGIPEDAMPHIFDRFYRVDKARSRAAGGAGLGLSIVYDMVQRNYGTISAKPNQESGTRFTVTFPLFELPDAI